MGSYWEQFVETHAQIVLDAALRILGNPQDAEDVAQEVYLEIFRSGRLQAFCEQPALLRTMSTRRALDRLRRRKYFVELEHDRPTTRDHEPSEYAMAEELDQKLRRALVELPPREAEVFCLHVLEGESLLSIASTLRISKSAAAKALCLSRRKLSAAFNEVRTETKEDG